MVAPQRHSSTTAVGRDAEALLGKPGRRRHGLAGVIAALDAPRGDHPRQFVAEGIDCGPIGLRDVALDETRLAQGHRNVGRAAVDQFVPAGKIDVMRFDFQ